MSNGRTFYMKSELKCKTHENTVCVCVTVCTLHRQFYKWKWIETLKKNGWGLWGGIFSSPMPLTPCYQIPSQPNGDHIGGNLIFIYIFLLWLKIVMVSGKCLKISDLYDENCACGTHLKLMRHPHNADIALS